MSTSRVLVPLRRLWIWYDGMLETRPLVTQAISTGVICGIGDVIAQELIERKGWEKYDIRRTAKFSMIGLLFIGPVLRGWYYSLDRILPAKKTITTGFGKMALDQLCFAPVLFSVLLPLFGATQGLGVQGSKEKLKKEYWNTLTTNWKLWPAVQMITFSVVPLKFRVLFVQFVSVGWNAYLAWVAFR